MNEALRLALPDETATLAFGARLAELLAPGDVVFLIGDLGAGKTTLARGVLGVVAPDEAETPSPTYAIVQTYETALGPLWHADLYRISASVEIAELGLAEALGEAVVLIEWPDRLGAAPVDRLEVRLEIDPAGGRRALVTGFGAWEGRVHDF